MSATLISDRYELGDRLGSGGMSSVYRATDRVLERTVAVKILAEHLSDDEKFVARFRREALAVAKLIHPNIVQVYDTGVDNDRHYIVMEYVEGRSGAQLLQARGRARTGDGGRDRRPVLRRARVRAPAGDHPPRRQAREPDGHRRSRAARQRPHHGPRPAHRRDGRQADRLRDRASRRADATDAGGLGGRHRRLPGARAGPRRGGDAGLRRLRARRRDLPAPDRAPSVGGNDAGRARDPSRERAAPAAQLLRPRGAADPVDGGTALAGERPWRCATRPPASSPSRCGPGSPVRSRRRPRPRRRRGRWPATRRRPRGGWRPASR